GNSRRGELGAVEIARDAAILAVEDLLVHLLEIEREVERAAQARVLELVAPDVEGERLHHPAAAHRKFLDDDAFVARRGKIVGGRPVLGTVLGPPVDLIALERLERDSGIPEILKANFVEIVLPDVDVEAIAPIVPDALVDDRPSRHEILDTVRTRAERRLERGDGNIALVAVAVGPLPPMFGQHGELADDQRQLAVARGIEREAHFTL